MGRKMSQAPEPKRKFKEGDRVREINKMQQMCVSPFASSVSKNVVTRIMADTRIGTVSATGIKRTSTGHRRVYVDVLWDGSKTPSRHEQMRLALLDNE